MMFKYILIPIFFILAVSCSETPSDFQGSIQDYEQLSEILHQSYDQNSQQQLDTFFEEWSVLVKPITSEEFTNLSQVAQEGYQIFQEFYSPEDLDRLSQGEHENFETDFRFIVVQNQLQIAVADTNPKFYYYRGVEITEYYIDDFRPDSPELEYPFVYLTEEADSVIYHFLFNADSTYRNDTGERVQFLRQAMQITPHHWIDDFHKYTMPHASQIIFNEEFDKAIVQFRIFFQFGSAYFEKKENQWELVESELTAIE